MEQVNELFEIVSRQLGAVAQSDVVVGTPVKLGAWTVVPVSRITIGLGAGGGTGDGDMQHHHHGKKPCSGQGQGTGGGGGGGGRVRPVAVLVLGPDGVEVLPIPNKTGKLDRLMDKLPEWIDRMRESCSKDGGCCSGKSC
jgi:uncharacterized spore protein YtfJ